MWVSQTLSLPRADGTLPAHDDGWKSWVRLPHGDKEHGLVDEAVLSGKQQGYALLKLSLPWVTLSTIFTDR